MRRSICAVAAAVALLFAACGGDDADDSAPSTEVADSSSTTEDDGTTTESTEDATTSTEDEDEAGGDDEEAGADGELTPGGTTLAFGEGATVEYVTSDDDTAHFEVTVEEIEESSLDDLAAAGMEIDEDMTGQVPHFIRYTVTNLTDVPVGGGSIFGSLSAVASDGSRPGTLITIGFDQCRSNSFGSDAAAGDSIEGCKVVLVGDAAEVTGVSFTGELDQPIVWQD